MTKPLFTELQQRGLIHNCTDASALERHLESPRTIYFGCDPTAPSLHVGNLLGLVTLRRFLDAGHQPIVLVGGGTGLIGDPGGKEGERALNSRELVAEWAQRIETQVEHIFAGSPSGNHALIANNHSWLAQLDAIGFLRDIGKHFPVSDMLRKESVASRLGREGGGISFTEFSYMILQAYDFLELYRRHDCTIQIGGSDQWGNMTAGCDLIRKLEPQAEVHALSQPLVTRADGSKFGKSEGDAIWLDPDMTSPYSMYQFWFNTADADVTRYLKMFTFLSLERIQTLDDSRQREPEKREAQVALAEEVTRLVHGDSGLEQALKLTNALFRSDFRTLSAEELGMALQGEPVVRLAKDRLRDVTVAQLVADLGLETTLQRARKMLADGGVRVNGERVLDDEAKIDPATLLHGRYAVITRGKRSHRLVEFTT